MPTRMAVGHGRPVTKPSIRPATRKAATSPSTMTTDRRPSSASASVRVRSPGSMMTQPSRSPAPPAITTAVSSSRPWGRMSPKNRGSSPAAAKTPAACPTAAPLNTSRPAHTTQSRIPEAKQRMATRTLLVNTEVANWAAGSEE